MIDFKKAFDRVWHEGLWQVLRIFIREEGLVQAAVLLNSQLGEFFRTTVDVRQGFLLSSILFNSLLKEITQETLYEHRTPISIGGRPICNLRFADDIDLTGGSNAVLQDLTKRLVDRARSYGMEVNTHTKIARL